MALRWFVGIDELEKAVGEILGPTEWVLVDQDLIRRFSDNTGDYNWVHLDHERAARAGFGTTIAHGFLVLSLIGKFSPELIAIGECPTIINYGLDRVRFPAPCHSGSKVRATAEILRVARVDGGAQLTLRYRIEREGGDKPICVADQLSWRLR